MRERIVFYEALRHNDNEDKEAIDMQEEWIKLVVSLDLLESDKIDLISYALFELNALGVEVDYAQGYLENHPNLFGELAGPIPAERLAHPTEIIAYFEREPNQVQLRESIQSIVGDLSYEINLSHIKDENWQENWMANYQPEHLSRFMTIVPLWETYQAKADEHVILLDPGLAFGTGNHPTTRLGAQALEMYMRGGERVIDVGTGSGILSLVAAMLGAKEVWGYDLDPQAVESAQQNLRHQLEKSPHANVFQEVPIHFAVNDLLVGIEQPVDLIVANILPHILVNMFEDAWRLLSEEGLMILGGILEEKGAEIEVALKEHNWYILQKMQQGEWLSYVVKKASDE